MSTLSWYQRLAEKPTTQDILRDATDGNSLARHAKANHLAKSILRTGQQIEAAAIELSESEVSRIESLDESGNLAILDDIANGLTGANETAESAKPVNGTSDGAANGTGNDSFANQTPEYTRSAIPTGWPQRIEESGLLPDFELDDSQKAAVEVIINSQYSTLIGAAGTGKTTLVKYILSKIIYGDSALGLKPKGIRVLSDSEGPSIALCAFTGIATQVLSSNLPHWLRGACKTIHTLLEYKPVITESIDEKGELKRTQVFLPSRDASRKLNHDVIVIDEASMLGLDLWHNLLAAMRPGTKVILIGDLNQLRPVADQTMFAYAMAESIRDPSTGSKWRIGELTTIHRQSEAAANRIIEAAHEVLNGKSITFDDSKTNPNWRVLGYRLKTPVEQAHREIIGVVDMLRKARIPAEIDPDMPAFYDPYADRIMTAGNGYDENNTIRYVQQAGINETLSRLIQPPTDEHPMYIIDAGITQKRFAVGHRVMALKNESPDVPDRVTNGMTGVIEKIEVNGSWTGNRETVGPEQSVLAYRRRMAKVAFGIESDDDSVAITAEQREARLAEEMKMLDPDTFWERHEEGASQEEKEKESFGGGPASHKVTVRFDNGATRVLSSKAQIQNIQLAYATTVHKAQGSQCDTAIIVVHHAVKAQLSREWLYTAITRAKKRVVILYTDYGLRIAISKQQIFGASLAEKILRYQKAMLEGVGPTATSRARLVQLTIAGEE